MYFVNQIWIQEDIVLSNFGVVGQIRPPQHHGDLEEDSIAVYFIIVSCFVKADFEDPWSVWDFILEINF